MSETIITKTCSKCKIPQPISEFYKRKDRPSGYKSECKTCHCDYKRTPNGKKAKRKYKRSPKGIAAKQRFRKSGSNKNSQKHYIQSEKGKLYVKRQRQKHRINFNARASVNAAVNRGTMPRPDTLPCAYCGNQASEYHHTNGYSKPHYWDVVPTCLKCHNFIHKAS